MIFAVVAEKLALYSPDGVPETYVRFLKGRGWRLLSVPLDQVMHTGCNVFALGEGRVLSFAENEAVNGLLGGGVHRAGAAAARVHQDGRRPALPYV